MKKIMILLILFCIVSVSIQSAVINGTYLYKDFEYMQIENDSFKIISYARGVDDDSIVAQGSIKKSRESNFIELTSKPIGDVCDNIKIEECCDSSFVDSVKIMFVFPCDGKLRIFLYPESYTYSDSIMISKQQYYDWKEISSIEIFNCNSSTESDGTNFGRVSFECYLDYMVKNANTNVVIIKIPNLTNSYFRRYVISNEYAKVDSRKLLWRGRVYKKVSERLIAPAISFPIDKAMDETGVVDPAEEYLKKNKDNKSE